MDWDTFLKLNGTPPQRTQGCSPQHTQDILDAVCTALDKVRQPHTKEPVRPLTRFTAIGPNGFRREMVITPDGRTCPADEYMNDTASASEYDWVEGIYD